MSSLRPVPSMEGQKRRPALRQALKKMGKSYQLYLFLLIPIAYIILFNYVPMYGVQIAFRDFSAARGITGSPWVGMKHFIRFFTSPNFSSLIINTLRVSLLNLVLGFPIPIILALSLNAMRGKRTKRIFQTGLYIPYFISTVVVVGMMKQMLSPKFGVINKLIEGFGGTGINFFGSPQWFALLYVISDVWQTAGYTSIIYLAALTSIDQELYDAAAVDGATRMQQIRHIELPGIVPTISLLLILRIGEMVNVGFEKVFLMQTPLNYRTSEILNTYVYKIGVASTSMIPNYSYGAAIGLFNAVVSLGLVALVNGIVKRLGGNSLW